MQTFFFTVLTVTLSKLVIYFPVTGYVAVMCFYLNVDKKQCSFVIRIDHLDSCHNTENFVLSSIQHMIYNLQPVTENAYIDSLLR